MCRGLELEHRHRCEADTRDSSKQFLLDQNWLKAEFAPAQYPNKQMTVRATGSEGVWDRLKQKFDLAMRWMS